MEIRRTPRRDPSSTRTSKEQIIKQEPLRATRTRLRNTSSPRSSEEHRGDSAIRSRAPWYHSQAAETPRVPKDRRRFIGPSLAPWKRSHASDHHEPRRANDDHRPASESVETRQSISELPRDPEEPLSHSLTIVWATKARLR